MNTSFDYAQEWLNFGATPIPMKYKSKLPLIKWKKWNNTLPPTALVKLWFSDRYKRNIGVICGMNGLTVIDIDDMALFPSWYESLPSIWRNVVDTTYSVKTSRGMHYYVKVSDPEFTRKLPGIDIRAQGSIVVCPPSIHPTGHVYQDNGMKVISVDTTLDIFPYPVFESKEVKGCWENQISDDARFGIREIKENLTMLKVISGYTTMRSTSCDGRWWMGRCPSPYHRDTHPSFRVDTKTNRCTCLSGGCILYHPIGLDIFDLYCRLTGKSLKDAIAYYSSYLHQS